MLLQGPRQFLVQVDTDVEIVNIRHITGRPARILRRLPGRRGGAVVVFGFQSFLLEIRLVSPEIGGGVILRRNVFPVGVFPSRASPAHEGNQSAQYEDDAYEPDSTHDRTEPERVFQRPEQSRRRSGFVGRGTLPLLLKGRR